MKILAVSDHELPNLYQPGIRQRFGNVDMIIGCGDMGFYYLEYLVSTLDRPLYYVHGNHTQDVEFSDSGPRTEVLGGVNMHGRVKRDGATGLLLAGMQGSLYYNGGPNQYHQGDYRWMVYRLVPRLLWNKLRYGRYLDVFVAHAPPWKINDAEDLPHRGVRAYNWLIRTFRPAVFLHGHVHIYRQDTPRITQVGGTRVINTCGYQVVEVDV